MRFWLQVELMGKPALVIYNEALQLLGLEASEVIAIGDSLVRCMCWCMAEPQAVTRSMPGSTA